MKLEIDIPPYLLFFLLLFFLRRVRRSVLSVPSMLRSSKACQRRKPKKVHVTTVTGLVLAWQVLGTCVWVVLAHSSPWPISSRPCKMTMIRKSRLRRWGKRSARSLTKGAVSTRPSKARRKYGVCCKLAMNLPMNISARSS